MARLDRAIALNIVLMQMARLSRAMTLKCVILSSNWYNIRNNMVGVRSDTGRSEIGFVGLFFIAE
jgi:hypothetical protein